MKRGEKRYIWQARDWPAWRHDLTTLTEDVVKTSEIEGELLNIATVRSSVARRLGVDIGALAPADRHVDGVVEMVLDATALCDAPLSARRLLGWHAALFPTGYGGLTRIRVGAWRNDANGPMQVVSGPAHRPRVHFEAPPAERLRDECARFFEWANTATAEPAFVDQGRLGAPVVRHAAPVRRRQRTHRARGG
jgi:Fic family protein